MATETATTGTADKPGVLTRHRTYTLRGLIPMLILLLGTNVGAWFRLDSIADARAADLAQAEIQRGIDAVRAAELEKYRDCVQVATVDTKMRTAFAFIAEQAPSIEFLQNLAVSIAEKFPASAADCPVPPNDGD